jgi:hypothetical protein
MRANSRTSRSIHRQARRRASSMGSTSSSTGGGVLVLEAPATRITRHKKPGMSHTQASSPHKVPRNALLAPSSFPDWPETLVVCGMCNAWFSGRRAVDTIKLFGSWVGEAYAADAASLLCDMCGGSVLAGPQEPCQILSCHRCDAEFTRSDRLLAHSHLHIQKKAFGCDTCPAKFCRKHRLVEHLRSAHGIAE